MNEDAYTYESVKLAFGEVLTLIRKESGLSVPEFAKRVGMSVGYYVEMEMSVTGGSLHDLLRVAHGIGCKAEELVTATLARLRSQEAEPRVRTGPDH